MMRNLPGPLLVITDRLSSSRAIPATIEAAIRGGANWFWLRDRDLPCAEREALGRDLGRMLSGRATLTIGGDAALAARLGAGGVHLPGGHSVAGARALLGQDALIGTSAHNLDDVGRAAREGANYVTLSPIFPTASKPGYGPALGPETIRHAAKFGCSILALGGVTSHNSRECLSSGAAGVAVMGGVFAAPDPELAVRRLMSAVRGAL